MVRCMLPPSTRRLSGRFVRAARSRSSRPCPLSPSSTVPAGANGIKFHGGWVYVSVTGRNAIYRIQVAPNGRPKGALQKFAEGFRPDDFDITHNGTIYASSGTTLYKVAPDGTV